MFAKGDKVRVLINKVHYPGTIGIAHRNGNYGVVLNKVTLDTDGDGFIDNVAEICITPLEPPIPTPATDNQGGDTFEMAITVNVVVSGGETQKARIMALRNDGTYDVQFLESGDIEEGVAKEAITKIEPDTDPSELKDDSEFSGKLPKVPARPQTTEERERAADEKRKEAVDATNAKNAEDAKAADAALANTPLTAVEKAFVARIRPLMDKGCGGPSPAEITKYASLIKRIGV